MENKIPTAEEFAWSQEEEDFKTILAEANYQEVYNLMIEFTKLHVQAALESAAENYSEGASDVVENLILNAYPLDNIK